MHSLKALLDCQVVAVALGAFVPGMPAASLPELHGFGQGINLGLVNILVFIYQVQILAVEGFLPLVKFPVLPVVYRSAGNVIICSSFGEGSFHMPLFCPHNSPVRSIYFLR